MRFDTRDKKTLYVLAAAIAVLASIWAYRLFIAGGTPVKAPAKKAKPKADVSKLGLKGFGVDLSSLEKEKPPLLAERNIFGPVYAKPKVLPPPPAPPKPPVSAQPAQSAQPAPPPQTEWLTPEKRAADAARKEMAGFKYMGFLKRKDRTDIFLALGNEYFIAGKDDIITKQYFIKEIGKDYILFADKDSDAEVKVAADFTGEEGKANPVPTPGVGGGSGKQGGGAPGKPKPNVRPATPPRPSPRGMPANQQTRGGTGVGIPGGDSPTPPPVDAGGNAPSPLVNRSAGNLDP